MPPDAVIEREESTAGADKGKGQAETVTISKADFARMERERDEAKQSERYWADRARANGKGQDAEREEEPGIDASDLIPEVTGNEDIDQSIFSDPEKWVAAVAKGPAAIEALIRKGGYVNAKQVVEIATKISQRTVNATTTKITADNRFISRYPDLQNTESELFKAAKVEYNEMLAEMTPEEREEAKRSPLTLRAATRTAEAKIKAAKAAKPKDDDDEFEYDRVDPEAERRLRVRAQDGSRGGRGGGGEEESRIGPQQRAVLEGMGVSEDKFRTSEKNIGSARRRK